MRQNIQKFAQPFVAQRVAGQTERKEDKSGTSGVKRKTHRKSTNITLCVSAPSKSIRK